MLREQANETTEERNQFVGSTISILSGARRRPECPFRVMCGRRPRCKENLTFGLRSGASHVSGLFARHHDRWP